jgi:2-polyprenyl-3-methyl-5-hydroxy-6-metoxy-1,4-benzoquinol methylase/glycosyltransferase involved in cell wall biosynthesis
MNDNPEHKNGYCVVCGSHSSFRFDPTIITLQLQKAWGISANVVEAFNRKESMFCSSCGASLRIRRLTAVLIQTFAGVSGIFCRSFAELLRNEEFRRLKIAEINACGTLHEYLKEHPNLFYSQWLPHAKPGEVRDGVRCEDLQHLTYPDNYFDIILTCETLEHVPEPDKAWREIRRTLKDEGYHIFTIPIVPWQREAIQRARIVNGIREDLLEPAYHGPWGREDVFVYTDFGMDVLEKLNDIGLKTEVFYLSPESALDVAVVFRSRKAGGDVKVNEKGQSPLLESTGERYLPWLEEASIGYEHIHRYAYATQFVRNKRVLDLACGEGYGSYLLAKTAKSVAGIDIDNNSIKHARNKYIKQNLEFRVGSITEIPIDGERLFDVAICFEALEHIEDHQKLLSEVKRLLTPDGVFIVSTPNKTVYSDEPQFNNPFHVHELYFDEFRELLEKYFKNVKFLGQRIYCNSNIWPVFAGEDTKVVEYVVDKNPAEFVFAGDDKKIPRYFIAIASDAARDIEDRSSALVDVSNALLNQKDSQISQLSAQKDSQIAAHVREQERLAAEIHQLSAEKDSQIAAHVREQERLAGQIAGYVRQQERLAGQIGQLSAEVQGQGRILAEGDRLAARLQEEKEKLERDLQKQQSQILKSQESLSRERAAYSALAAQAHAAVEARRKELDEKEARIQQVEATLSHIYSSHGWKALTAYYQLRNQFLPEGTKRREIAKSFWKFIRKTSRFLPAENNGAVQSTRTLSVEPVVIKPVIEGDDVPKEEVTVSVVIPTKNGGEDFRRVLATIANQKGFQRVETIVVDSGSTDKTVELAEQFGSKIIKILPEEFSHSYARNLGASYASGEYLLFTVQDALPPSDSWLYELFSVIKSNNVVAVSCAEFPWESADLFYRAITWNHYRFLEVDREDRIMRYAGSEDHLTLRKNGQLSDLACLISKDVFTKYKYKTDYGEDLDLGVRLIKDGYQIAFLGSTRIIHSHNRPAYYYLKRGYVENVFLPRIFSDYPTVGNSLERVIPDVLFTHQVIKSMVEERTWNLQFPCKTGEFSNRIIERFQAASKAPSLMSTQMVDGDLLDIEFQDFLGRLARDYPVVSSDARSGDGDLSEAVRDFTKMILAYMESSYELVDDHIAEDFRLSLYKTFAYQCGAKLAQCSLRNDDGDRQKLEQIHGELTRGV